MLWYTKSEACPQYIDRKRGYTVGTSDETMTAREAQEYLGISNRKMAQMLDKGILAFERDPLDQRVKLIPRAEVEALRARSKKVAA